MTVVVPAGGFTQEVDEFAKTLSHLVAHVKVGDDEGNPIRNVSYLIEVPDEASGAVRTLDYREQYRRVPLGWERHEYHYEHRTSDPKSRRAHHQHDNWGIHQHCEPSGQASKDHYADVERLRQATHQDFELLLMRNTPLACLNLVVKPALRRDGHAD